MGPTLIQVDHPSPARAIFMFDRTELRPEGTIIDQKWLSQAREGPFYVDLKRSVPYLKGPIPDIRNIVQDLRWFILDLGEPILSMRGFNLCLRGPKRYKTVHPRCKRDHCRLERGLCISVEAQLLWHDFMACKIHISC